MSASVDEPRVYRSIQPKHELFRPSEILDLFAQRVLTTRQNYVVDNGFLKENAPADEWDPHLCPVCKLVWDEVVFSAADYLCRCGCVFLGVLEDEKANSVWDELWCALLSMYEQSLEEDTTETAADMLVTRIRSAKSVPPEVSSYLTTYGFKFVRSVCGQGASSRLPVNESTAVWLPYEACVMQTQETHDHYC